MYATSLKDKNFSWFDYRIRSASVWIDAEKSDISFRPLDKFLEFFTIKHLLKKLHESQKEIEENISSLNKADINEGLKMEYANTHKNLLKLLDKVYFMKKSFETSHLSNGTSKQLADALLSCINVLMQYEFAIRLKVFPERNVVPLSYEELKELRDCYKGWEPAEEQSEIYS